MEEDAGKLQLSSPGTGTVAKGFTPRGNLRLRHIDRHFNSPHYALLPMTVTVEIAGGDCVIAPLC